MGAASDPPTGGMAMAGAATVDEAAAVAECSGAGAGGIDAVTECGGACVRCDGDTCAPAADCLARPGVWGDSGCMAGGADRGSMALVQRPRAVPSSASPGMDGRTAMGSQ